MKLISAALLITACLLPASSAAASSAAASSAAASSAAATSQRSCRSADLRYPFQPGGPRTFGVFELATAHGSCATAHAVAKGWMSRFETAFRAGRLIMPRSVDGFRFKTLPAHEAQAFRERGEMGATTISFVYRIPNG
jgi:hypothetical protein